MVHSISWHITKVLGPTHRTPCDSKDFSGQYGASSSTFCCSDLVTNHHLDNRSCLCRHGKDFSNVVEATMAALCTTPVLTQTQGLTVIWPLLKRTQPLLNHLGTPYASLTSRRGYSTTLRSTITRPEPRIPPFSRSSPSERTTYTPTLSSARFRSTLNSGFLTTFGGHNASGPGFHPFLMHQQSLDDDEGVGYSPEPKIYPWPAPYQCCDSTNPPCANGPCPVNTSKDPTKNNCPTWDARRGVCIPKQAIDDERRQCRRDWYYFFMFSGTAVLALCAYNDWLPTEVTEWACGLHEEGWHAAYTRIAEQHWAISPMLVLPLR
jgi:hypothetical protein